MRRRCLLLAVVLAGCLDATPEPTDAPTRLPSPWRGVPLWPPASGTVELLVLETEAGRIEAVLYADVAPRTVELMRALVAEGYYVGREFQRIVPGHVIQITSTTEDQAGDKRRVPLEVHPDFDFAAGAVGTARDEDLDSGGPQFFIADFATHHLHLNYTVWGQVVRGMDVVHKIARGPAVEAPRLPNPAPYLADRIATDPVAITRTEIRTVAIEAEWASRLPMRVAPNLRVSNLRHTFEWPNDLAPGQASRLTWYARPYDASAPPPANRLRIEVEGPDGHTTPHSLLERTEAPGAYDWTWTPVSMGRHEVRLRQDGATIAQRSFCLGDC